MAAELVGGAVLSSILNVVFDRMSSPEVANWIKGKKLTQKLLERLKTTLYAVQAFLIDAEQKQIKERAVKDWLDTLKDAMYVADDLLDEVFTKAATQKDPGTFFSRYLNLQDREIANCMEEIIDKIESIVKQKDTLGLREIPKENMSWRITTSLVERSNIYGREKDKETLKLNGCSNLKILPAGMQNLVNLRHLDITGTCLHEMPKGMSKLKGLQFLSDYIVGKHEENKIKELGALANLHQSLSITKLENVVNSNEASEARMCDKDGINSLSLWWSVDKDENTVDSQIERDILDKLRPHSNLKELQIRGYRGTTLPDWLGHSSYHNITKVLMGGFLSGGFRNCCMLPSLGELPSLKHLKIKGFERLGIVGAEFYQNHDSCVETPFPMLETLWFESMPCWKEWRSLEFNAFPRLRKLTIWGCPMLTGDLPNHLPSLKYLDIRNCEQLSSCLPRAPAITKLCLLHSNNVRILELPPLLHELLIKGKNLVEAVVPAIKNTQLSCLTSLSISDCSSHILFPLSSIPASVKKLRISSCRNLEFQIEGQHDSLHILEISNSCDSVTSFSLLDSFPNLVCADITDCEKMELKSISTLWTAAPQLENLTIMGCPEIDLFAIRDPHCSLRSLRIGYFEKLVSSAALMNLQFHGLTHLTIEGECESVSVKSLPKEGWLPACLESLILNSIKSVETLECKGLVHLNSLRNLTIIECPKLENIEGEKLPASLIRLIIKESHLLGKRCEMKDLQVWPKISHIRGIQVNGRWIWMDTGIKHANIVKVRVKFLDDQNRHIMRNVKGPVREALVGGAVLSSILNVVFDAEQKQIKERAVKDWLDSLKDAMYVADDLLDEVFTKAATQKDPGTFFSRYLSLQDREIANRVEEITDRIESIVKQKDTLGLREIPKENMSWRIKTSLVDRSNDHEFDKDLFVGKREENKITELGALANLHKSRMFDKNGINSLKELIIRNCPMLRGDLPNHLPSLQLLKIIKCSNLSSCLPRVLTMTSLHIVGGNKVRIGELPPLLRQLSIKGKHQVEFVVEAIANMQLT
ncbi:hypothetical protein Ahy_A02g005860 isoform A [Arachis hypogaea]|uniref:Rx N-terminal domain-containing protein n=1 Tax=Arachis hypogaea TaxID=3818 RepID=A0A445E885_ARAHY|nr:hypothetical protein Ahy_A02g005860 isoform A [Arachis hypogaea]